MPQSTHARASELHNLAIHAHQVAVVAHDVAHDKEDHLTAHELSKRALEHSMNAFGLAEKLAAEATQPEIRGRKAAQTT